MPHVESVTDGREAGTDKLVVHVPKIKNIMYHTNSLCPEYSSVVNPDPHGFVFFCSAIKGQVFQRSPGFGSGSKRFLFIFISNLEK